MIIYFSNDVYTLPQFELPLLLPSSSESAFLYSNPIEEYTCRMEASHDVTDLQTQHTKESFYIYDTSAYFDFTLSINVMCKGLGATHSKSCTSSDDSFSFCPSRLCNSLYFLNASGDNSCLRFTLSRINFWSSSLVSSISSPSIFTNNIEYQLHCL